MIEKFLGRCQLFFVTGIGGKITTFITTFLSTN